MSIAFGSPVSSANVNANMASKNVDNTLAGKQTITNTTQSTDKDTGSIVTEGGIGVEKNINAGGTIAGSNLSGSNTGDVTLSNVGAIPNAQGAVLSGQALALQPADGSNPGLLTAGTQSIGGNKTFTGTIAASNLSGTNTGDVDLSTITGTLVETKGGTNQSTYATGDILYASASNTLSKLAIGTNGQVLKISAGLPGWGTDNSGGGGLSYTSITTKTANYTVTTSDQVILCDTSSGGFTLTLPTAVGNSGTRFVIKKIAAANSVIIDGNGSQTIDGVLTQTLTANYTSAVVYSDGANWLSE